MAPVAFAPWCFCPDSFVLYDQRDFAIVINKSVEVKIGRLLMQALSNHIKPIKPE